MYHLVIFLYYFCTQLLFALQFVFILGTLLHFIYTLCILTINLHNIILILIIGMLHNEYTLYNSSNFSSCRSLKLFYKFLPFPESDIFTKHFGYGLKNV